MTLTRDSELVQRAVLSDCSEKLLIEELERRGWGRGWVNVGAETFYMLLCERDDQPLPFEMEFVADFDEGEALSA